MTSQKVAALLVVGGLLVAHYLMQINYVDWQKASDEDLRSVRKQLVDAQAL